METVRLSELVSGMLAQGVHPRQVRLELARRGIRWSYAFTAHKDGRRVVFNGGERDGKQERGRNLRRLGLKACEGCGQGYPITDEAPLCPGCLIRKWAGGHPL